MLNVNGISGSTGKIVTDIKNVLESNGNECLICYGANDHIKTYGYERICGEGERKLNAAISRMTGILHGVFTPFSYLRFKKVVETWHPDIVHIHCPNGYIIDLFKTLEYLAENNIKTVLTNHAEYFYTGGCGYAYDCLKWKTGCYECDNLKSKIGLDVSKIEWNRYKAAFDKFSVNNLIITSVSPWVEKRSKESLTLGRFTNTTVMNGVNTDVFKIRPISNNVFERLPKDKPIVLHVTAEFTTDKTSIKGGYWIREVAKNLPNLNFVVACNFLGKIEDLPSNVMVWGRTSNQNELAELYNASSLTLLSSKRETFSMIVAESLSCGTPLVGYKSGGPESIAIEEYTEFVNYGDINNLKNAIELKLKMTKAVNRIDIEKKAHSMYSKEAMTSNYLDTYSKLLNWKNS